MNLYEVFFMLQFLIVIGIILLKLLNIMRVGSFYTFEMAVISFIGVIMAWGIGFVILLANAGADVIYSAIFHLESWLFPIVAIEFFIEIIFLMNTLVTGPKKAYKPD